MKLELKENMYVRTKDGYISQYKYYDYNIGEGLIGKLLCIPLSNGTFANIENIKKFSYNIIDILEVGDYVNGSLVVNINYDINLDEDKAESISIFDYSIEGFDVLYEKDIKSIVTKEAFSSVEYRMETN